MNASQLHTCLDDGLAAMHIELPDEARAKLLAYLDLLAHWNRTYNLTAVREPEAMVARHLLDSLAVLPYLHGTAVADLGTGAGLPGVPLAIARPGIGVTLVDSNGKKARFLREAVRSLPLPNAVVEQARVEDVRGRFDTVTSRALATLTDMLAWGGQLLAADGHWLAMKGRASAVELAAVPAAFRVLAVHPLAVPGVDGERCVIELVRA